MPDERRTDGKWSYSAGAYGATVRVYERTPGGRIYATAKGVTPFSLGHSDREQAKDYADEEAKKLRKGLSGIAAGRPTVARIFRLYRTHRVPEKSERVQKGDDRRLSRWRTFLGEEFDLRRLSRREWDGFLRQRRSGAIDANGRAVPESAPCPACEGEGRAGCDRCDGTGEVDPRRPVGDRTLEKDLRFLRTVCTWATEFRDDDGRLLLDEDPTRGHEIPRERNPSRPVATHDRVDAIREVYRDVRMRVDHGGDRRLVESWLPEVFEVVVGTGRRIGAVRKLRIEDLELDPTPRTPHGAIVWPEDTDKMGRRWRCPISEPVREALEAARRKRRRLGRVGPGYLFPTPADPDRPVRDGSLRRWLERAEELAGVEPHDGSLWHAYRRLWASARKRLPDVDVARAGGWASLAALQQAYQQPDDETMLRVVEHDAELREVR